ncbi:MAG: class II fructose-bisphosphate aldolase [Patescibacteria group bacterium]
MEGNILVSLDAIVPHAFAGKYAIGAFNVTNIESAQAVILAAEELKSPAIVQTSEKALDYAGFDNLTGVILQMAKKSTVPIVIHLDHGRTVDIAQKCLEVGYTSVMVDFNHDSFEDNLSKTIKVVAMAKKHGASVEAELGAVMGREDYIENKEPIKTNVAEAVKFTREAGVNVLAVGIGNAHGITTAEEKLDFDLLKQIQEACNFPLVLHGASGNSLKDIHIAIRNGVVKINIDTDLRLAFSSAVRQFLRSNSEAYDIREIIGAGRDSINKVVKQKMVMFGSVGKA